MERSPRKQKLLATIEDIKLWWLNTRVLMRIWQMPIWSIYVLYIFVGALSAALGFLLMERILAN